MKRILLVEDHDDTRRILARLELSAEQEALVGVVVPSELRALAGGEGS